jgi:formate hydrogenlyase subunit 4
MSQSLLQNVCLLLSQIAVILFLAPLIQGIIKKTKALLQNRIGPPLFQPYYDIIKNLKKDAVISREASWLTRAAPYIVFGAIVTAGLIVPVFFTAAPLGFAGDLIAVVYLVGMARFFTALAGLDAGGSFGGMGSSREMALGACSELALLLALFAVCLSSSSTNLSYIASHFRLTVHWDSLGPSHVLAMLAMLIVIIAETGRVPVDNPDTHLELTMIHEGMLLEYSGRYLGLMAWAAQIKQLLILNLFICAFFPWGIFIGANETGLTAVLASIGIYLLKLVFLAVVLAFTETIYAKVRLFIAPKLIASSMVLSFMAILMWTVS